MNYVLADYRRELCRPWKLATLTLGISLLIWGSCYYQAPDWDIPNQSHYGVICLPNRQLVDARDG